VITTHDLPTFVGWWHGLDTDLRQNLGIYDPERAEKERAERVVERGKLAEALQAEKLLATAEPPEQPPAEAVMRFLARTPSALNAIQYEDVLGARSQPNVPGTTEGHPNWRRKLDLDIGAIDAPGGPLAKVAAAVSAEARGTRASTSPLSSPPPRATYRFQFHKGFTFDDAIAALPYVKALGISHVYSSPIAKARPGSTHGYDIVDPSAINPELGGEEGFCRLSDALKEHGLGLILDIVPNHLGVGGADNPWWLATLEWGQLSPHSRAFDIDWERLGAHGKLVIPVLGDRYGDALEKGDLKLAFDDADGSFAVWHYEHKLPLTPCPTRLFSTARLPRWTNWKGTPRSSRSRIGFGRWRRRPHRNAGRVSGGIRTPEAPARGCGRRIRSSARGPRSGGRGRERRSGPAGELRHAPSHPGDAVLQARALAGRGQRHQLPALLRHQMASVACGSSCPRSSTRPMLSRSALSARGGSRGCGSTTSTASPTPKATSTSCRPLSARASTSLPRRFWSPANRCVPGPWRERPATTSST
jgi:hypothetical protein